MQQGFQGNNQQMQMNNYKFNFELNSQQKQNVTINQNNNNNYNNNAQQQNQQQNFYGFQQNPNAWTQPNNQLNQNDFNQYQNNQNQYTNNDQHSYSENYNNHQFQQQYVNQLNHQQEYRSLQQEFTYNQQGNSNQNQVQMFYQGQQQPQYQQQQQNQQQQQQQQQMQQMQQQQPYQNLQYQQPNQQQNQYQQQIKNQLHQQQQQHQQQQSQHQCQRSQFEEANQQIQYQNQQYYQQNQDNLANKQPISFQNFKNQQQYGGDQKNNNYQQNFDSNSNNKQFGKQPQQQNNFNDKSQNNIFSVTPQGDDDDNNNDNSKKHQKNQTNQQEKPIFPVNEQKKNKSQAEEKNIPSYQQDKNKKNNQPIEKNNIFNVTPQCDDQQQDIRNIKDESKDNVKGEIKYNDNYEQKLPQVNKQLWNQWRVNQQTDDLNNDGKFQPQSSWNFSYTSVIAMEGWVLDIPDFVSPNLVEVLKQTFSKIRDQIDIQVQNNSQNKAYREHIRKQFTLSNKELIQQYQNENIGSNNNNNNYNIHPPYQIGGNNNYYNNNNSDFMKRNPKQNKNEIVAQQVVQDEYDYQQEDYDDLEKSIVISYQGNQSKSSPAQGQCLDEFFESLVKNVKDQYQKLENNLNMYDYDKQLISKNLSKYENEQTVTQIKSLKIKDYEVTATKIDFQKHNLINMIVFSFLQQKLCFNQEMNDIQNYIKLLITKLTIMNPNSDLAFDLRLLRIIYFQFYLLTISSKNYQEDSLMLLNKLYEHQFISNLLLQSFLRRIKNSLLQKNSNSPLIQDISKSNYEKVKEISQELASINQFKLFLLNNIEHQKYNFLSSSKGGKKDISVYLYFQDQINMTSQKQNIMAINQVSDIFQNWFREKYLTTK